MWRLFALEKRKKNMEKEEYEIKEWRKKGHSCRDKFLLIYICLLRERKGKKCSHDS